MSIHLPLPQQKYSFHTGPRPRPSPLTSHRLPP